MEGVSGPEVGCSSGGDKAEEIGVESLQFGEDIERLMAAPTPETASSFTALLELPANQAVELLHSPDTDQAPAPLPAGVWSNRMHSIICTPTFPSNAGLLERASKFSFFAAGNNSAEVSSIPGNSSLNQQKVKQEPADSDSNPKYTDPIAPNSSQKSTKRKEREKKGKWSSKKSKNAANDASDDGEKLPYVHVRARRGQATDNHSLAERARREKINARMKLLQEIVPGCSKISGTALVLDEIINHVQYLQREVEVLSMRLAAVNPRIDFNLDSLLAAENGSPVDSNSLSMVMPLIWPEGPVNRNIQHSQQLCHFDGFHQPILGREDIANFIAPENSLLSYNSSTNSVSLHSNQLRMQL